MSGFALTTTSSVEVIAAWTAPSTVVSGVTASPGWMVIGQYDLPKSVNARLDVVHVVSASGLTSRVRLWDATAGTPVDGSVATASLTPVKQLGAAVNLTGGRTYQVQAECTGATGEDKFSVVLSATLS